MLVEAYVHVCWGMNLCVSILHACIWDAYTLSCHLYMPRTGLTETPEGWIACDFRSWPFHGPRLAQEDFCNILFYCVSYNDTNRSRFFAYWACLLIIFSVHKDKTNIRHYSFPWVCLSLVMAVFSVRGEKHTFYIWSLESYLTNLLPQ